MHVENRTAEDSEEQEEEEEEPRLPKSQNPKSRNQKTAQKTTTTMILVCALPLPSLVGLSTLVLARQSLAAAT